MWGGNDQVSCIQRLMQSECASFKCHVCWQNRQTSSTPTSCRRHSGCTTYDTMSTSNLGSMFRNMVQSSWQLSLKSRGPCCSTSAGSRTGRSRRDRPSGRGSRAASTRRGRCSRSRERAAVSRRRACRSGVGWRRRRRGVRPCSPRSCSPGTCTGCRRRPRRPSCTRSRA